jgi:hypothetical protein
MSFSGLCMQFFDVLNNLFCKCTPIQINAILPYYVTRYFWLWQLIPRREFLVAFELRFVNYTNIQKTMVFFVLKGFGTAIIA